MSNEYETAFLCLLLQSLAAQGTNPWIVHTNVKTIQRLELETWEDSIVVSNLTGAVAVDFHYTQGYLYWADQLADRITRAKMDNLDEQEDIVIYSPGKADGIAIDWIHHHLYWIDAEHKHVKVSKLDGTFRKTLVGTGLRVPKAIAVHPILGFLFFTDVAESKIFRCGLDGSDIRIIVSNKTSTIQQPNGLSIDFSQDRIYWVDRIKQQIGYSNLDGTSIQLLPPSSMYTSFPWGLAVFREWIYWTSFSNQTIYRVDKQTGTRFEVVKTGLNQPVGIKIYSQETQPSGTNLCAQNNGGCEQLCLAKSSNAYSCVCADGFQLRTDGKSCLDISSGNWLTFTNLKTIERLDIDTSVTEIIASNLTNAVDLDIHYNKGLVYWTDVREKTIKRTSVSKDTSSGESEVIIAETVDVPDGIAIDWIYNLLFWTDAGHNHIQVARLDGTQRKTIIKDTGLDQPRAIAVDPKTGWLFFSDWGTIPRIERCRMDGGDRTTIIRDDIVWPNGISLDQIGKRLYWIDGQLNQIKSTKFDGTDTYTILKSTQYLPKPFDLVIFNSYIYWSNWQYRSIYRINKYTGQDIKQVANYVLSPMGIKMFGPGSQADGVNLCGTNNGGCSHLCFPLPDSSFLQSTQYECMCPDFYLVGDNKRMCEPIEPPTDISINTTGDHTEISWKFPKTNDFIIATNITLYDANKNTIYTSHVYYPSTTLSIRMKLVTCQKYSVKMRCQYSKAGWSLLVEKSFWVTDNIFLSQEKESVNISWTTKVDRLQSNVWFQPSAHDNDILLYSAEILQQSNGKYSAFIRQGREILMTISGFNQNDIGLYKSTPLINSSIVDGCALVLLKDSKNPVISDQPSESEGSTQNIAVYVASGVGSLVVVLVLCVILCYRRRTNSQRQKNQRSPNVNASENRPQGVIYDSIDDDLVLTTNMERNGSNMYLDPVPNNPYQTLGNTRTEPKLVYDDLSRVQIQKNHDFQGHHGKLKQNFEIMKTFSPEMTGIDNPNFINQNQHHSNT